MGGKRSFGTVRQLRSGRWQARYTGPDGLVRPAPHTFERRRDAEVWLAKTHADIARDDWLDPDGGWVPLQEYAAGWVRDHAALGARSRERYEDLLRLHIDPYLGGRPLVSIKEANVRQWRQQLLGFGVGPPTVAKSYRLLRAIMNTAVDDLLIRRNPCRIKGAGEDRSPTRPILTIAQVYAVADSVPRRYHALVLLATFCSLRFGELAALRRSDVDLGDGSLVVTSSMSELRSGELLLKEPKSEAGRRRVAIPAAIAPDVQWHLDKFARRSADAQVFSGPKGGLLRRSNFRRLWTKALLDAGVPTVHFHDLRHTGNTIAAATGASTRELMTRMGHSSTRAALIYQHATDDRDRQIADGIDVLIQAAQARQADMADRISPASGTYLARNPERAP